MEVDLHVTNRCNFRCKHCVYKSGEWSMPDMTLDTVKNLVDDFKEMGVEEVHITGGEPLLNPELFAIISTLRSNGFLVRIQTNGMLINEETADKLRDSGVQHVLISIDGLKNSHNAFRRNERSFDIAIQASKICLKKGLFTRINTVIHKSNVSEIPYLIRFIKTLNVDQHSFFYLTPTGRGESMKSEILSLEEWKNVQRSIIETAISEKILDKIRVQDVYHENDVHYNDFDICRKDNCLILANGDVFHCVFFVYSNYKLGNIYKSSLSEIWKNLDNMIESINNKRKKRCNNSYCGGGCPGMSFIIDGDVCDCDSRCQPEYNLISSCIRRYRTES